MSSFFHPLSFTLVRLMGAPVIVPSLIVWITPYFSLYNCGVGFIFLILCLTDFLDGFVARRYNLVTEWGAQLDPIADKLLIFSASIALLSVNRLHIFWVILFIARDVFIMGLRTIALMDKITIPVSGLARCKTFFLMAILFLLIIIPPCFSPSISRLITISLASVALVSVVSALMYYRDYRTHSAHKTNPSRHYQ